MTAQIIDGKKIAAILRERIAVQVARLDRMHDMKPGLAVVLVGEDPASQVYVRNKEKAVHDAGMASFPYHLPAHTTQADLLVLIKELNERPHVHGILVQLPLPAHIDTQAVLAAVNPAKDVDGFHPVNAGRLASGMPGLVPCTPKGCMILLQSVMPNPAGRHAVVVGRSNIVGKPVAQLLLQADCTVTIAHSRTVDIQEVCKSADILVAAVGKPQMVKGSWIKKGAVVIDVGINRVDDKLVGDVAFAEACKVASAVTPVPGGVGPMTIACLLRNTLQAACSQQGYAADFFPELDKVAA